MAEQGKTEWVDWQDTKVLQKVALVDDEGNVLALKRSEVGPGGRLGKWDLPGGSINPADLKEDTQPNIEALIREVEEETGLKMYQITPIFVDSWIFNRSVGKILGVAIGYSAKVSGTKPDIKLSDEHIESKWGSKDEILGLDFGEDGGLHSSILKHMKILG